MSPPISNDLNSPVSLLWAHQLRREHATVVSELQELKSLHPSASELKKMMANTQKAEENIRKVRRELVELRTDHQKTVKSVEALKKEVQTMKEAVRHGATDLAVWRDDQKQLGNSLRFEIQNLREFATVRGEETTGVVDEIRNAQNRMKEERVTIEQELKKRDDQISEVRDLIRERYQELDYYGK
jgi:chromosome segregation ATPase